ncbi:hypothetical protein QBC46DRAFT_403392 [Diplogelasinospora grovesii]|uniref:Uncharacterized protein n=1 Tax=Diplogelasinospora grovesii TaxID=303347 RepID=A0AAN6NIH0_9PEZI|nr:hypothetical protein QBC46DRAFT_403392 [Diplogelasinospora grovesii]
MRGCQVPGSDMLQIQESPGEGEIRYRLKLAGEPNEAAFKGAFSLTDLTGSENYTRRVTVAAARQVTSSSVPSPTILSLPPSLSQSYQPRQPVTKSYRSVSKHTNLALLPYVHAVILATAPRDKVFHEIPQLLISFFPPLVHLYRHCYNSHLLLQPNKNTSSAETLFVSELLLTTQSASSRIQDLSLATFPRTLPAMKKIIISI